MPRAARLAVRSFSIALLAAAGIDQAVAAGRSRTDAEARALGQERHVHVAARPAIAAPACANAARIARRCGLLIVVEAHVNRARRETGKGGEPGDYQLVAGKRKRRAGDDSRRDPAQVTLGV